MNLVFDVFPIFLRKVLPQESSSELNPDVFIIAEPIFMCQIKGYTHR